MATAATSARGVECPRYTQMMAQLDIAQALMRILPPSASVTTQFVTSCEALKFKRNNCKKELEKDWDQPVHRSVTREALIDYYYQLASPPMSDFSLACLGLTFQWRDSLQHVSKGIKDKSGLLELCNVIYNIGCTSAGLGSDTLKTSRPDRFPRAKRHFEEAAGAFAEVRSILEKDDEQRWRDAKKVNLELQPQALDALIQCMTAYAARCFYDKAVESSSRPKLLAQVGTKVSKEFSAAAGRMQEAVLAKKGMDKWMGLWYDYLDLESSLFCALACIHAAEDDEAACRPGQQRIRLQEAVKLIDRVYAASNSSKGGGKLFKLHRPDLLRLSTQTKSRLSTLEKDINDLVYGQISVVNPDSVKPPEPAKITIEPRSFKEAVKEAVEPTGAARPPVPLLFQGVIFDTGAARRAPSQAAQISDSSESDDGAHGVDGQNPLDEDEDVLQPQVSVGEPLPSGAHLGTSCPSPRLPHHLAAPRAGAVPAVPTGGGAGGSVRDSRAGLGVRGSQSNKGDVIDDDDNDPAASSEQILRRAREAREEEERKQREERERRESEARRRQEDWQRETIRRQEALALDRPPIASETASLSSAVNASLSNSLTSEEHTGDGQRLGGREGELMASREREPPAMPAAAETRRRALEAAEARRREAVGGGVADGDAVPVRQPGEGSAGNGSNDGHETRQGEEGLYNGMRVGDVAAPGYLFGGLHLGVPFYVCQATNTSIWELPAAEHLAAVARTQGTNGASSQLRPGDPVPGHPGYLFGGYSSGLPFYHHEDTGRSVWELPRADAVRARAQGGEPEPSVPQRSGERASGAGADAEANQDMSGEAEVEAALVAQRRRRHPDSSGPIADASRAQFTAQEEADRAMAARLQAEFEAEERETAARQGAEAHPRGQEQAEQESAADAVEDTEAVGARQAQAAHDREMRRQQEEQTALEERLRREAAGRHDAQESAARRAVQPDDAATRQRYVEEERRATELMRKEEQLRSKEREIERKMKELEDQQRMAARQRARESQVKEESKRSSAAGTASAAAAESDEVPNEYLCPITMDIMRDPVIAMDGHTYDRKAISSWLTKSQKSPKTNTLLPSKQVMRRERLCA